MGKTRDPGSEGATTEAATDRDQRGWLLAAGRMAEALGEAGKGWDASKFKCLVVSANSNTPTIFYGERRLRYVAFRMCKCKALRQVVSDEVSSIVQPVRYRLLWVCGGVCFH